MLRNQQEKGAALLTVLFIIILFTILGFSLSSFLLQGAKQRAFANDQIEGKLLADTGLLYFKKHMEKEFTTLPALPSDIDGAILNKANEIAAFNAPETTKENIRFHPPIWLPASIEGSEGGFAIAYTPENVIPYSNEEGKPTQPYIRKIKLYIAGIPARAVSNDNGQKRVLLETTVYLNTLASPFRFAVSTPNDLRLMGGSNIIGNIAANNVITSTDYQYSDPSLSPPWKKEGEEMNKPYVEGKIILSKGTDGKNGGIYSLPLSHVPASNTDKYEIPAISSTYFSRVDTDLQNIRTVFSPKKWEDVPEDVRNKETEIGADFHTPYIPGYDVPTVESSSRTLQGLAPAPAQLMADQETKNNVQFDSTADLITGPGQHLPLALEEPLDSVEKDGFDLITDSTLLSAEKLVIASNASPLHPDIVPLTARLTGKKLYDADMSKMLFIGPTTSGAITTVEMGRKGSFIQDTVTKKPTNDGDPFTYNGSIYIHGNLDIVGDISVNGTIYVDGDVIIREARNVSIEANRKNNLAIIASGTITLTDRPNPPMAQWLDEGDTSPVLSAFLYSEKNIEIYSVHSFNWINGGIASNGSYIELNTKREAPSDPDKGGASRLVVQFNRGIFEQHTPGLPPGNHISVDVYDLQYGPLPRQLDF